MAIKNIIARGIGFSPGSVKFIPTHGFASGVVPAGGGIIDRIQTYLAGAANISAFSPGSVHTEDFSAGSVRTETH